MCGFAMRYRSWKGEPSAPTAMLSGVQSVYSHPQADGHTALQQNSQVQAWEAPPKK